ncbi:MAG: polyribonucleotide nucleotidyltransferase [Firmicutes bacterium]|nr:polyribonucleotide nucleotidyltransferase [Bacillota bacterium]
MQTYTMELQGRMLTMETGRLAKQASGAVLMKYGDTVVLVTATVSDEAREGIDFFPMTVDYEERLYAVGRIPGGFIKREGRPTERAILGCRLTDRSLRPLFPKGFHNSVHIVATVLSMDQDCPPEPLSIIGASAALSISKIPFEGPVAAVIVALIDGEPVINPNQEDTEKSDLHLMLAGTKEAVMMVEAGSKEISKEDVLRCIEAGHEQIKNLVTLQEQMVNEVGISKMEVITQELPSHLCEKAEPVIKSKIEAAFQIADKREREDQLTSIKAELVAEFTEEYPENEAELKKIFEIILKKTLRELIIEKGLRADGRSPQEIRPISCELSVLPRTHGSAVFTRGQTQVMNVCTLSALRDVQMLDGLGLEESKRFIHHYNFPPFSVGEAGFMRGPGRREIGHGALAERALEPVVPSEDDFPYTIRLVSEVLESNGSTSMGSVCSGSLSMMDTGVPIKRAVAGIAMGLIKEGEQVEILSDIQGMEDFLGDMDFKVAGTEKGITAIQMDIKIKGISSEILKKALERADQGYRHILGIMNETISVPRPELSPNAPRMIKLQIAVDKIRDVIGPGGRMINKIIAETGVGIDIEPDGRVFIAAVDPENGKKALQMIENLVKDVKAGEIYNGKVTRVERYGAFVELLPGKEGLLHISHMAYQRVDKTEDVVNLGDMIEVKVTDIDEKGRINLSRKALLPKPEGYVERESSDRGSRDRGNRGDRPRPGRS